MKFDASSSALSNGENRSSPSCFYQKLYTQYSSTFFKMSVHATRRHANKTDLIEILLLYHQLNSDQIA